MMITIFVPKKREKAVGGVSVPSSFHDKVLSPINVVNAIAVNAQSRHPFISCYVSIGFLGSM